MATLGTAPIDAPALARTYDHPSYEDPWRCVEDYFRVLEYAAENPDTGSTSVATSLGLPRSRIRPWLDGSRPDPVRGVQIADGLGWLAPETGSQVFRGLNVLVAWIFSSGSLRAEWFVPQFVADHRRDVEFVHRAASVVGVDFETTRQDTTGRAREYRPTDNASVLGRALVVLGAPIGEKNERSDIHLPGYLADSPRIIRKEFAAVYLRNRANPIEGGRIRFREERPRRYLTSLVEFLRGITGKEIRLQGKNVALSQAAGEAVRSWPEPLLGLG